MTPGAAAPTIDDQAFTAFLQRAMPSVHAFLRRLCNSAADADDVLQETLAKVWRLRTSFDPEAPGKNGGKNELAWLRRAAFRTFCDHRQRSRRQPAASDTLHQEPAPAVACRTELRDELQHRLKCLPDIESRMLLGFHRDGLSLRDLAAEHDLPVNTVKSHLHRARRRLHDAQSPEEL